MQLKDAVYRPGFRSIIDTHCHYNLEPIYDNWHTNWQKAQENGVIFSWIPGTNLETSKRAIEIAHEVDQFQSFIGIHPTEVMECPYDLDQVLAKLEQLKHQAEDQGKPIMGVGEIGLDYFRVAEGNEGQVERQEQQLWFRAQLRLANRWGLPVILHVRDRETPEEPEANNAYWDVVRIVEDEGVVGDFTLHCVSGPVSYVRRLVAMGAYAGFDGNISYPNAHYIRELWRVVPADRRLLETDAPYLPPQGYRGQVCEPWMIALTHQYIEETL